MQKAIKVKSSIFTSCVHLFNIGEKWSLTTIYNHIWPDLASPIDTEVHIKSLVLPRSNPHLNTESPAEQESLENLESKPRSINLLHMYTASTHALFLNARCDLIISTHHVQVL
jgi:hypothetical protein